MQTVATSISIPWSRASPDELMLTRQLIDDYIGLLSERGKADLTCDTYKRWLLTVLDLLPPDKRIRRGTLKTLRNQMRQFGYAPQTINCCMTAVNGLLKTCDCHSLQLAERLEEERAVTPELTRTEYLRLLSTAKMLGKEREYLLTKVFATLGISVSELSLITVEAVERGCIAQASGLVSIPKCLCEELLHYAQAEGKLCGPIFTDRKGSPLNRSMVTHWTQSLCEDAKVSREKANPRCLRKLCQATRESIRQNLALLVEQSYERMLETEQLSIGWK